MKIVIILFVAFILTSCASINVKESKIKINGNERGICSVKVQNDFCGEFMYTSTDCAISVIRNNCDKDIIK